jgi:23S rRNA (uracil1939-C5)-methyltransferase
MGQYFIEEKVRITKLVNGGQGLGTLSDGRYAFVWNALPNELVKVRLIKNKKSYAEGIAEEIIEPSLVRVEAKDVDFLATSPWQIINPDGEKNAKLGIVEELFYGQKIGYLVANLEFINSSKQWLYRNKMEYGFWGDDNGLHLAIHQRGSRNKQIVEGSSLAMPEVDRAAKDVVRALEAINVQASSLKSIVVRASQKGRTAASLLVRSQGDFDKLLLPSTVSGLKIYFSNPKSPASVPIKLLNVFGDTNLDDYLFDQRFCYDADAFFQINIPTYIKTLEVMRDIPIKDYLVDMYCGVGSIGLTLSNGGGIPLKLVEVSPLSARFARLNVDNVQAKAEIIVAPVEKALDMLATRGTVIFDPPRAGLHPKLIQAILISRPKQILYLSCNPATLVRDIAHLTAAYNIKPLKVFNFFPKTPHIEMLAILELKT